MSNRWKLWLGVSALALASGTLPGAPVVSPIGSAMPGIDLAGIAWAQESDDESGEGEGAEAECTSESGEGEEGGDADCPAPSGEEGEGG